MVCRIQLVLMKHFAIDEHLLNTNVYKLKTCEPLRKDDQSW